MAEKKWDVVGLGNAVVDVVAQTSEEFLDAHSLNKSTMTLIDRKQAEAIYTSMPPAIECSGGSVANSIAGIASFGGNPAFIGKVHDDQLGKIFTHDMRAIGAEYSTSPSQNDGATARCLVSVTPDAQRTMATYLGDNVNLTSADIDPKIIEQAEILYVEGYLWDDESPAKQAIIDAVTIANNAGVKVAFSLSDPFCVERHREGFLYLLESHIDILFANEAEITSLFQAKSFEEAVKLTAEKCEIAALTRSEQGSVILHDGKTTEIAADTNVNVVDTTGAGDLYASGFLYGLTQGYSMKAAGELATIAASHIISHLGARPTVELATLNSFGKRVA